MPQFMLLLYDNPADWQNVSPEEMQEAIEKYRAWREKPFTRGSLRLSADAGRVLRPQKGGPARSGDGPFIESKEVLGGYYIIEAPNYDEAVKIAMDHPHLEYGGTVEIRKEWQPGDLG